MKQISLLLMAFFCGHVLLAQAEDAEGCKDHPMLNRMPNFTLHGCTENYASLDVIVGAEAKTEPHEGTRTHLKYLFNNQENTVKNPSWLQVKKNYENAVSKIGGKRVFSDDSYASFKLAKDSKEIYVQLQLISGDELSIDEYWVDLLETEPMKQDVQSDAMYKEINEKGSIALYINFETGKSTIQSESLPVLEQMAQMLRDVKNLKVRIDGHTDNVGSPAANQKLSEQRAASLVKALIDKGIDKSRLSSKGWGQSKPIADNATDDGKAKNRRVEIIKM